MTFEEAQQAIAEILAMQKGLQTSSRHNAHSLLKGCEAATQVEFRQMTFEEMQQEIAEMLAVQKELQTSQVEFRQSLLELRDGTTLDQNDFTVTRKGIKEVGIEISNLKEVSLSHERRMQQLFGCSASSIGDRLDLLQRIQALERRTSKLEEKDNEPPEDGSHPE